MRALAKNILLSLIFGILAGEYWHFNLLFLFLFFSIVFLIPTRLYSLYLLLSSLFSISYKFSLPNLPQELYYRKTTFKGIIENPSERDREFYILKLKSLKIGEREVRIKGKVNLFAKDYSLSPNDFIEISGSLLPLNYPSNPNLFDGNQYWRRQGFVGNIQAKEIKIIKKGKIPVMSQVINSFREYSFNTIEKYLKGPEKALLLGLLFGETKEIPKEVKVYLSNAGVYHILAVSGLHIGILAFTLLALLSFLRIRALGQIFIITAALLFYLAAVDFSPSATRATIIFLLVLYSYIVQRKTDPFHSLVVAAILILFFAPVSLFDIGFQLSFVVTGFILTFARRIYQLFKDYHLPGFLNKYLFLPFSVSLSSLLGAFPLTWFHFYRIPIISPFANLFIVPLVGFAIPLILLILTVNIFLPPLAHFFSFSLWITLRLIWELTRFFGRHPFSALNLAKPPIGIILLIYLLILLTLRFRERPIKKIWLFLFLGGVAFAFWSDIIKRQEVRITFLDTYSSEPVIIEDQNKVFLILSGRWDYNLENFLLSKGIKELEILFLPKIKERSLRDIARSLKKLRVKNIIMAKGDTIACRIFAEGFSSSKIIRIDQECLVTYPGIEFQIFPFGKFYNLQAKIREYDIFFYSGSKIKEGWFDIIKINGNLRQKRIEEIIAKNDAQYFILQGREFYLRPSEVPRSNGVNILDTNTSGAIEITIKEGRKITLTVKRKRVGHKQVESKTFPTAPK